MKRAAILHGTGCHADSFWQPWLKTALTAEGYDVWVPSMPEPDKADLSIWAPFVQQNTPHHAYDLLVGHSAGCPLILHLLNTGILRAARTVLVAGFLTPIPHMPDDHQTLPRNLDFDRVRDRGGQFVFIHSDNDPWGCDHHQGESLRQALGGTLVVASGVGHFGSAVFKQPYDTFPLLRSLCLDDLP